MRVQLAQVGTWEDSAHDLVSDMVSPHHPIPALSVAPAVSETSGITAGAAGMVSSITGNTPDALSTSLDAIRGGGLNYIGGDNVDNLFASIAIMLMLTVIPNMAFNAWRIRREQKEIGH